MSNYDKNKSKITFVVFSCFVFIIVFMQNFNTYAGINSHTSKCMALNLYFEANAEGAAGQTAVGMVTLNRAKSRLYPNSICAVVYQEKQFSWTWDERSDMPVAGSAWNKIMLLSSKLLAGNFKTDITGTASHYYNPRKVKKIPKWAKKYPRTAVIGDHDFHRMPNFMRKKSKKHSNSKVSFNALEGLEELILLGGLDTDYKVENLSRVNDSREVRAFTDLINSLPDYEPNGTDSSQDYDTDTDFIPKMIFEPEQGPSQAPETWTL